MKLNLFCFIIFSLNTLTITSNFVYPSTLSSDNDLEVIEADARVKRNITQVKQTDFEEQEDEEEEGHDIQLKFPKDEVIVTSDEKDTDGLTGVHFPRELYEVEFEDPCLPSPCGGNFSHWLDVFNNKFRRICLPNYIRSSLCNPECPFWCPGPSARTPCSPSPCGPHSHCREVNTRATCRCQSDFIGRPPNCRRECTINSECASDKACLNRKCVDPCVYKCARNANCTVVTHNPICSLRLSIPTQRPEINPCIPSPCGLYSQCQEFNGHARCTCLPNYSSSPPRCRLECTIDSECNTDMVCINNRCTDPCPRDCGNYAQCIVKDHISYCTCLPDSCQALDQTHDFPRYPEWSAKFDYPKEKPHCSMQCILDSFRVGCPSGTERLNDLCVEVD